MQKKILASLLVTPLAFNAFADINLDNLEKLSDWVAQGLVGDQLELDEADKLIRASVGTGSLTQKLVKLPKGKYTINFTKLTDGNAKVNVTGAVKAAAENNGNTVVFESTGGDVTVTITAVDATRAFEFAGAQLVLNYDFEAAYQEYTQALNAIKFSDVPEEDVSDEAKALRTQKAALEKTLAELTATVETLNPGTLDVYAAQELFNDPNNIDKTLEALQGDVKTYNDEVTAETTKFNAVADNTAALNASLKEIEDLEADLKTVTDKINAADAPQATGVENYLGTTCTPDAEKIAGEIAAYKTAVEEAYKDLTSTDIKAPESQVATITDEISHLNTKYDGAVADIEAYNTFFNEVLPNLEKAYGQASTNLTGLKGVKDKEDIFNTQIQKWQSDVAAAYNGALADMKIKKGTVAGAADLFEGDKQTANTAAANMAKIAADNTALVNGQNDLMNSATTAIAEVQASIEDLKKINLKEVQDVVAAQQTALDDVTKTVNDEYANLALTENSTDGLAPINKTLADLTAQAQPIIDIQKEFDEAKAEIKNKIENTELKDKFNGTFTAIQEAIDALTLEKNDTTYISAAIKNAKDNATALVKVFGDAQAAVTGLNEAMESIDDLIQNKLIIEGSTFSKENYKKADPYLALSTKSGEFAEQLKAAAAAQAQECYDLATALDKAITDYDYPTKVNEVKVDFETKATQANEAVATNLLASVKTTQAEGEYAGKDTVDFTEIDATMAGIATDIQGAIDADPFDAAKFNACDTDIEEAIKAINALKAKVESLKANQAVYDNFMLAIDNPKGGLQQMIEDNAEFNKNTSIDPAKAYFAALINGTPAEGKSHQAQLDELKEALNASLDAFTMVADQDKLNADLIALKNAVANVKPTIQANETAHNNQIAYSKTDRDYIEGAIADLEARNTEAGNPESFIAEWKEQLNSLLESDLTNLDRQVYDSFAIGQSGGENDETYKQAYKAILENAQSINETINAAYDNAVKAANEKLIATDSQWASILNGLNDTYKESVKQYNYFMYGLTNEGYKDYIRPIAGAHEVIYQYSAKINELRQDVIDYVKGQTDDDHVITDGEFKTNALDKASTMTTDMNNEVATMIANVNAAAETFYNTRKGEVEGDIEAKTTQMSDAGVTQPIIDKALELAKDLLQDAVDMYATATKAPENPEEVKTPLGIAMDDIANKLDEVVPAIDVDQAAANQWTASYTETTTTADELMENLTNKDAEGYLKFADKAVLEAQLPIAQEAFDAIAALKGNKSNINNLKDNLDGLADELKKLQDAYDLVKASNDTNKNLKDAYDGYLTDYNDLTEQFQSLEEYVNSFSIADDMATAMSAIEAQVESIKTQTEANSNNLLDPTVKAALDKAVEDATDAINNAYGTAASKEETALDNLLDKVKVAFNDAKVNGNPVLADIDAINTKIDETLAPAVEALLYTPETKDNFKKSAVDLENELTTLYQKLQASWSVDKNGNDNPNPDPLAAATKALQDQYDTITEALEAAKAALENSLDAVKENPADFAGQYASLAEQLDAIKAAWEAQGDRLIITQGNYAADMKAVDTELTKINAEVAAAQQAAQAQLDKQNASNAAYATLLAQWEEYNTAVANLRTTIEGYGLSTEGKFTDLDYYLAESKASLEASKEAFSLTAASTLPYDHKLKYGIGNLRLQAAWDYASTNANGADTEITATNTVLTGTIVPEIKAALNSELNALRLEADKLDSDIQTLLETSVTFNNLDEVVAEYEAIAQRGKDVVEKAKDIASRAEENVFVPGDVNLDPDGEVNVTDVQMLITWVGDKVTYEQLYEQSPRQAAAADLNGDQIINIADVTADIRLAMDMEAGTTGVRYAMSRSIDGGANSMDINPLGTEDGVRRYALNLNNTNDLVAGQIDIILPAGVELVSATLTERATDHQIAVFNHGDSARLVICSMTNSAFEGHSGALVIIETRGAGTIDFENVVFADAQSKQYNVQKGSMSFIDAVYEGARNVRDAIYNVAGQARESLQRGINIIRHSDGSVTKEIRK